VVRSAVRIRERALLGSIANAAGNISGACSLESKRDRQASIRFKIAMNHLSPLLPLSQAHLYILLSLSTEHKHGYAIMQDVREISEGTYKLGPATLYENLAKLLALGVISEVRGSDADDERRRYYRLTVLGKRALKEELARLNRLVARVDHRKVKAKENPA
jgi:DNA-binding PadR family transcriptional regulator